MLDLITPVIAYAVGIVTGVLVYRRAWRDNFYSAHRYYPARDRLISRRTRPTTTPTQPDYDEV